MTRSQTSIAVISQVYGELLFCFPGLKRGYILLVEHKENIVISLVRIVYISILLITNRTFHSIDEQRGGEILPVSNQ